MSGFVLHFGENFMKIASKIRKLQLITFRFVVGFDAYFKKQISIYFWLFWSLILHAFEWFYSKIRLFSFSSPFFPILNVSELFFPNQAAPGPWIRKVGKSLPRSFSDFVHTALPIWIMNELRLQNSKVSFLIESSQI